MNGFLSVETGGRTAGREVKVKAQYMLSSDIDVCDVCLQKDIRIQCIYMYASPAMVLSPSP
jgi:hypothetical protein